MFFLTPIRSFRQWTTLPWVTLLLSVMILGNFALNQLDDKTFQKKAEALYFNEGLADIELPQYIRFMQRYIHFDTYYNALEGLKNERLSNVDLFYMSQSDPLFQESLSNGSLVTESHPKILQWIQKHRAYEYLLNQNHQFAWGFKTAQPSWQTFALNGLVHEHWSELIINVFLLLIVGLHLEQLLRSLKYLMALCLIQLVSWSTACLALPYSWVPISGVSGLVAGILALYCLLLGFKKIDFFVSFLHFREVLQLPALVVLPVAVILFFIQTWFFEPNIATFYSIAGGLVAGASLFWVFRGRSQPSDNQVHHYQNFQKTYDEAIQRMNELNFPRAKKILFDLHAANPNHLDVLFQLFNVTKMDPGSEDYHLVVQKIFSLKFNTKAAVSMMNIVFKNYIRKAEPSIRFDPKTFLILSQKFRKYGYLKDSEQILKVLVQTDKKKTKSEFLAGEQLALARAHLACRDHMNATRILDWCYETYPTTVSGREAKQLNQKHQAGRF